ncbi:crystallin beta gamma X isoform X2 [Sinocyclocheilus grahami]|uniref:Gamma-crystallin N-A-like n=1 Tax=Sinocyclocheilus grahami TaxID=75366 RepID=A0A672K322_SINGR|nr:PREDICTED: gamma-crystallin N-A-like isoform X1 [Sinocyclocheilus grahami]XP_016103813.1 PREDICTED: gamma-crystallin N-A-like isoform X1 [Sinocyclocheilus grahami]XP_016103814.1 PREDICTED: gamma-crystallin N-A-like isoform X2 [Sinocyclocheilus grahami]
MNIFTKVPGLAKQTSKLGSVLQRAFYGSSGRVTLFEQRNFAGRRLDLTSDCQKLSEKNFPDRCNSVQVESGAWVAYEHENFRGRQYLWDMFDRGEYNCTDRWCAQGDHISSVHAVKQDNNPPRAQLFERAGFSGKKTEFHDDIPNLMSRYSLNRVSSVRVMGGTWVAYQEPNYRGAHYILEKKDYNSFSDWGAQNSTIGSIRRVRFS